MLRHQKFGGVGEGLGIGWLFGGSRPGPIIAGGKPTVHTGKNEYRRQTHDERCGGKRAVRSGQHEQGGPRYQHRARRHHGQWGGMGTSNGLSCGLMHAGKNSAFRVSLTSRTTTTWPGLHASASGEEVSRAPFLSGCRQLRSWFGRF